MFIDYVNNHSIQTTNAITILYIILLILWNILSFSGAFSLKGKHTEMFVSCAEKHTEMHVSCACEEGSRTSICRVEVLFSVQTWQQSSWEDCCLVSLFIGQIISLNGVLLLILVFELYLESAESTQSVEIKSLWFPCNETQNV